MSEFIIRTSANDSKYFSCFFLIGVYQISRISGWFVYRDYFPVFPSCLLALSGPWLLVVQSGWEGGGLGCPVGAQSPQLFPFLLPPPAPTPLSRRDPPGWLSSGPRWLGGRVCAETWPSPEETSLAHLPCLDVIKGILWGQKKSSINNWLSE